MKAQENEQGGGQWKVREWVSAGNKAYISKVQ